MPETARTVSVRSPLRHAVELAVVATLYVGGGLLGLALAQVNTQVTLVWPPTGIALAALLRGGRRLWPAVAVGALVTNLLQGASLSVSAAIAVGNTLGPVLAAWTLAQRFEFHLALDRRRDVLRFAGAVFSSMLVPATVGASALWLGNVLPTSAIGHAWICWWIGDSNGALVLAPLVLFLTEPTRKQSISAVQASEYAVGLTLAAALAALVFLGPGGKFVFLITLPVVWASLRFAGAGAALVTCTMGAIAVWGTATGHGAFADPDTLTALLVLSAFLSAVALLSLLVGAMLAEQTAMQMELRASLEERQRAIDTQRALEEQLRQSDKLRALGTLAGGIAHDFNNLLMAILGSLEIVAQDLGANHPSQHWLSSAIQAGTRARDAVAGLLTFAQPRTSARKPVDLGQLAHEVQGLLSPTFPKDASLTLNGDTKHLYALADASQLHQVIVNLVRNAQLALVNGAGAVTLSVNRVLLDPKTAAAHNRPSREPLLCISVRDTGVGMDETTRARIFEPFFTTRSGERGTGLGLATVHSLVQAHGGFVTVESAPGRGSTFGVYLPPCNAPEPEPLQPKQPPTQLSRGDGLHVLVVDDDAAVRNVLRRCFEAAGFRVTAVDHVDAALEALHGAERFDLLVTDHTMPDRTGIDLAREVQQRWPNLPIILISGQAAMIGMDALRDTGIVEVVAKPFSPSELTSTMLRVYREHAAN